MSTEEQNTCFLFSTLELFLRGMKSVSTKFTGGWRRSQLLINNHLCTHGEKNKMKQYQVCLEGAFGGGGGMDPEAPAAHCPKGGKNTCFIDHPAFCIGDSRTPPHFVWRQFHSQCRPPELQFYWTGPQGTHTSSLSFWSALEARNPNHFTNVN